ncbi:MAG: hypothetical protein DRI70_05175 [Bacteroidetes bacterium]|nr:MAG: hypothetical protein DRI70_05175 [Bacteroidota bacterium]
MKFEYLIFILLFNIFSIYGQEEVDDIKVNGQTWLDYNVAYDLDEYKTIGGFIGYRTISPHIYDNFLLTSNYSIINQKSLKFLKFLKLEKPLIHSYHFGARVNYVSNKNKEDDLEFRLMQGAKFFIPSFESFPLLNYIRLEERFQKTFDGSKWVVGLRFRYRISTVIEWNKLVFDFTKGFYIPMNIEFFFNLKKTDRFNDVIRISPGIGYKLNEEWRFELYGSYHNTLNTTEEVNTSNDFVLRLRIHRSYSTRRSQPKNKQEQLKELIE